MTKAKDLTKEAPRSPKVKVGGYAILGRTIDKCRALLAGTIGEYHFDCPLDNMLFSFKGVKGADFKEAVKKAGSDEEIVAWLNSNGNKKSPAEIEQWSQEVTKSSMYSNPEKRAFFVGECTKLGLNPETATTFDWLETDDRASFSKSAPQGASCSL